MKQLFFALIVIAVPFPVSAQFIETTYASSEVETIPQNLPTGRAGRRYIQKLNEQYAEEQRLTEETVTSDPVPIVDPVASSSEQQSSSAWVSSFSSVYSEESSSEPAYTPPPVRPSPTPEEQSVLDELTLEQLEEYANEAEENMEEQLQMLEDGFTVTGTSTLGSPLSASQRGAILRRSIRTVNQMKLFVRALTESDDNLRQVSLSDERIEVSYRQRAKLFGFIPITYLLKTTVEDDAVEVQQPWWHFLARDDVNEYKKQLEDELSKIEEFDTTDEEELQENLQKKRSILEAINAVSKTLRDLVS